MRATVGARHASRSGRLNSASPLGLVLPTDLPAGALAGSIGAANWRRTAGAKLVETVAPLEGNWALGTLVPRPRTGSLSTTATGLARPAACVVGDRLALGQRHYAKQAPSGHPNMAGYLAAVGAAVATTAAPLRPTIANIAGSRAPGRRLGPLQLLGSKADLSLLRLPAPAPTPQSFLWTGPDAITGAGLTSLMSTEDAGWLTPVSAREALTRAAAAFNASKCVGKAKQSLPLAPLPFMFDLQARALLSHSLRPLGGGEGALLPFAWARLSAALESDIGDEAAGW